MSRIIAIVLALFISIMSHNSDNSNNQHNTGCMGNTVAAPCNVVIYDGNVTEWTTQRGD